MSQLWLIRCHEKQRGKEKVRIMASFSLQGEFPATSQEDWLAEIERVLKGRGAETLETLRPDGIRVAPLYGGRDAHPAPPIPSATRPWTIVQRADDPDAERGNGQILRDLEGGSGGLALVFAGMGAARGAGLTRDADSLATLLKGVHADMLHIRVEGSAEDLQSLMDVIGADAAKADISWCPDPLSPPAAYPAGTSLIADGRVWHEAGATDVQELGLALAQAVQYWSVLEGSGIALEDAATRTEFLLAADTDIIGCVAKMRAMRLLWARLLEAAELEPGPAPIHAETCWRMMTARDAHTNMLRSGAAALAAAAGGADSITVLPFTAALGLPDSFARRVARNSQIILQDESGLALVSDPAAGSGAVEALTGEIAAKAWGVFQEIQRQGGLEAALTSGQIDRALSESRSQITHAVATRRTGITGLSEYADLDERLPDTLPFTAQPAPSSALPRQRLAEPFEALRRSAENLGAGGKPPRIFMANLGKGHAPRAIWCANLFAAGGIAAEGNAGFETPQQAAEAFAASGLASACICGDDEAYAAMAGETAAVLKATGARHVCLAGRPKTETGADQLIYQGCDVVAALQTILDAEGTGS